MNKFGYEMGFGRVDLIFALEYTSQSIRSTTSRSHFDVLTTCLMSSLVLISCLSVLLILDVIGWPLW